MGRYADSAIVRLREVRPPRSLALSSCTPRTHVACAVDRCAVELVCVSPSEAPVLGAFGVKCFQSGGKTLRIPARL